VCEIVLFRAVIVLFVAITVILVADICCTDLYQPRFVSPTSGIRARVRWYGYLVWFQLEQELGKPYCTIRVLGLRCLTGNKILHCGKAWSVMSLYFRV
jgi:hypothetical protein